MNKIPDAVVRWWGGSWEGAASAAPMRRFLPAGFEARNGVLIALFGLCLRCRHISADAGAVCEGTLGGAPPNAAHVPVLSPTMLHSGCARRDNERRRAEGSEVLRGCAFISTPEWRKNIGVSGFGTLLEGGGWGSLMVGGARR